MATTENKNNYPLSIVKEVIIHYLLSINQLTTLSICKNFINFDSMKDKHLAIRVQHFWENTNQTSIKVNIDS
ncbi:MAG: hypothetical protein AB4080_18330 [Trichodesmium sp.]